jgi:hypothetical protein
LKNAIVAFFNLAQLGTKLLAARKTGSLWTLFWHRFLRCRSPLSFSAGG